MTYLVTSSDGTVLDARFDIDNNFIVFHSRGGSKGKSGKNTDYSKALLLLLERIEKAHLKVINAWLDSSTVQKIPLEQRQIIGHQDELLPPDAVLKLMATRMRKIGQVKGTNTLGGNSTKRIRLQVSQNLPQMALRSILGGILATSDSTSLNRLPVELLEQVRPEHVWDAVDKLLSGYAAHSFEQSTEFDLLTQEGLRLAPKAVFGVAAALALGFEVLPRHFTGGEGSPCFRRLRDSGFQIVKKGEPIPPLLTTISEFDQEWTEGKPKLVAHLSKERARGLSKAKKGQFKNFHKKLFCERCKLDPVVQYGTVDAEACIEVHHADVQVKDMSDQHRTTLESLQCLCANCHRLVHKLLKKNLV